MQNGDDVQAPHRASSSIRIARAEISEAAQIAAVLEVVVAERVYSAIDKAWTAEEETRYIASLSDRESIHVAVDDAADGPLIIGLQSLERWSPTFPSMAHVGQIGTFLLPQCRGLGIGRRLWTATESFARQAGYRKLVAQVRASNSGALGFYRSLGFKECGRLTDQVILDGIEDDEVLMEFFL